MPTRPKAYFLLALPNRSARIRVHLRHGDSRENDGSSRGRGFNLDGAADQCGTLAHADQSQPTKRRLMRGKIGIETDAVVLDARGYKIHLALDIDDHILSL